MYFASVFIGVLMIFCISNIQAKPFFYSTYQDEDFGNDFADYFIDVDTSRTPTLRVNPFSLPANNEPAVSRAEDDDDSSFEIAESPVAYADTFELAFDEAADRLENILRLAVKKFKESFIQSFETIYNSSAIEGTTNNSSNTNGDKVINNITSNIVDVKKEKENENQIAENKIEENKIEENKMEENKTEATKIDDNKIESNKIEKNKKNLAESENKENMVEDNTIEATVQAQPAVDHSVAATDIKSTLDGSTIVDNVADPENEVKLDNEIMPDNDLKPDVQKTEAESTNVNENKQE